MQTRKTLVWLILFLVTVPTVAAAADAVERSRTEDTIIQMGHLREGERYVYDFHVSSESREMESTVQDFMTIEVGHRTRHTLLDGSSVEVLPVTTSSGTPPWIAADGESAEQVESVFLDPSSGAIVATETTKRTVSYELSKDGTLERTEQDVVQVRQYSGFNSGLNPWHGPGSRHVNANEVVYAILAVSGLADGNHIAETGTLAGETVYNVAGGDGTSRNSNAISCSIRYPQVSYVDRVSDRLGLEGAVLGTYRTDVWVAPGRSFPVAASCDGTYTTEDRSFLDHVRIDLTLAHHVPGGDQVVFSPRIMAFQIPESLPVEASVLPGLPAQGKMDLLFPLDDALDVLMTDPRLDTFRDDGDVPFYVTSFEHTPRMPTSRAHDGDPVSDVPDPLGLLPPETRGDAPRVDSVWGFTLQNAAGVVATVVVDRAFDAQGDIVDEKTTVEKRSGGTALGSDFPQQLPTMAVLLAQHAALSGTTPEAWLEDLGSRFYSGSSLHIQTSGEHEVHRDLRMGVTFHDPVSDTAEDGWTGTTYHYDLRTGAPQSRGQHTWRHEDVASTPAGGAPPALRTASVVPASHVPAAATASGLAVALAFVTAYFWEGISRVLIAPFYAKIRKDKVLDHATRDQIVEYVQASPGATLGAIRRHIQAGYGTAVHHLNTLERNGLLASRKVGRERCYFPAGRLSPGQMDLVAASGTDAASRLLHVVASEPGLTQQELAARLGVSGATVRYQAKRLLGHGGVRAERDGRQVRYYPPLPAVPRTGVEA